MKQNFKKKHSTLFIIQELGRERVRERDLGLKNYYGPLTVGPNLRIPPLHDVQYTAPLLLCGRIPVRGQPPSEVASTAAWSVFGTPTFVRSFSDVTRPCWRRFVRPLRASDQCCRGRAATPLTIQSGVKSGHRRSPLFLAIGAFGHNFVSTCGFK